MARPSVFDYENYRLFLKDWYAWMKGERPGFSYRAFSRWAGFSSPNHLQLIIQGRRNITRETMAPIVKAIGLKRREAKYFSLLVDLNQATSPEAKAAALKEISALFKKYDRNIEHDQIEYLSKWYYAVIRELVTTKGFRPDRHYISKRLGRRVTPLAADEAIERLVALGLLRRNPDGGLSQSDAVMTTGSETAEAASYLYHHQMIRLALDALRSQPPSERNFSGITFACRRSDIPEIASMIDDCRHQILAYLEGRGKVEDDEVYQLNIQLFRTTEGGEGS